MLKMYSVRYVMGMVCLSAFLSADVISPMVQATRDRLSNNPNIYDRVDNFCQGKKPRDACTISGPVISGGGEGTCINAQTNSYSTTIDLSCVRTKYVEIDRQLSESGLKDRFCTFVKIGNPCVLEFVYEDKKQKGMGTCNVQIETNRYYYQGYHENSRSTIQCQPEPLPARTYTPVSFIKKLIQ